jgi:PBP1b-binding outer membrane lipoprotein LpoB
VIVSAEQRGGFTGWTQELGPIDTKRLEKADAASVESAVQVANFFTIPGHLPGQTHVELVTWRLEVEDGVEKHSVTWVDSSEDRRTVGLLAVVDALISVGVKWQRVH